MLRKTSLLGDMSINPKADTLYQRLEENIKLNGWNSITICSAYLTKGAAEKLVELFDSITTRKRMKINLIVGSKDYFTQPEAIEVLLHFLDKPRKGNIEYYFVQPLDMNFHIKCYLFLGLKNNKLVIGSANLTMNGLESFGELLIEVNDDETINQVVEHIDYYYTNSVLWRDAISDYSVEYEKNAPKLPKEAYRRYANNVGKKLLKSKTSTIRLTSPTIGKLYSLESEKSKKIAKKVAEMQRGKPGLAKSNWIVFEDSSYDEIMRKYQVGSWFDRPKSHKDSWNIGANRMVGKVGTILSLAEDGVLLVMQKRSIHYQVTKRIHSMAKKLRIIDDSDEEKAPTKANLDKYVEFIFQNRFSQK